MANPRIDELRRRLEREPGSRLFAQLAEELRKEGELAEAIRVARAGLLAHPNYPSARLTLGRALFDTGDLAAARSELESVLRGAPDNILAARMLAECLEGLGDPGAALLQFRAALRLAPGDRQIEAQIRSLEQRLAGGGALPLSAASAPSPPAAPSASVAPAASPLVSRTPPLPPVPSRVPPSPPAPTAPPAVPRAAPPPPPAASEDFEDVFEPAPSWQRPAARPSAAEADSILLLADGAPTLPASRPAPPPGPAPVTLAFEGPPPLMESAAAAPAQDTSSTAAFKAFSGAEEAPPPSASPAAGERDAPAPAESPALSSSTLAEIYFEQGLRDKAIETYEELLEREPRNERARARLVELKSLAPPPAAAAQDDPRLARRRALERTIARLQAMLAAVRRR